MNDEVEVFKSNRPPKSSLSKKVVKRRHESMDVCFRERRKCQLGCLTEESLELEAEQTLPTKSEEVFHINSNQICSQSSAMELKSYGMQPLE